METEWICALESALSERTPAKNHGLATLHVHRGQGLIAQAISGGEGRWLLDDVHSLSRYYRRTGFRLETHGRRGYGSRAEVVRTSHYVLVTLGRRPSGLDEGWFLSSYISALRGLGVEMTEAETEAWAVWKREAPGVKFDLPREMMLFSLGLRRVERLGACFSPC